MNLSYLFQKFEHQSYPFTFLKYNVLPELTKAVALDEISIFRPGWNQTRAMDYFYYSGITNSKVSIMYKNN